jgi:hypothetical protein
LHSLCRTSAVKYCIDCVQQYCIDVNSFPFGNSFENLPNTTKYSQFCKQFEMAPGNFFFFPSFFMNFFSASSL